MTLAACLALAATIAAQTLPVSIVAHRGAMAERPENTMAAFERAVELGAHIMEVDVRTSADGHLFVLHDATLERTTDGEGRAAERTLGELQALDAGSWFHEDYAGLRIPTLAEVLEWGRGRTEILLDLKESGPAFADAVSKAVQEHGDPEAVIIGVRSPTQAREFRERMPDTRQLAFMRAPDQIEEFAEAGVDVIRLWLRWVEADPGLPQRVRDAGTLLMINGGQGHLGEARALMAHTPDWILIDDIAQLRASLATIAGNEDGSAPE